MSPTKGEGSKPMKEKASEQRHENKADFKRGIKSLSAHF
jgi:hypothetical protein